MATTNAGPAAWQAILESEYGSDVDSSLIAALVHEPGQTLDGARSILAQIAGHAADVAETEKSDEAEEVIRVDTYRDASTSDAEDDNHHSFVDSDEESYDDSSQTKSIGTDDIERALAEWKLIDADQLDPMTLRMTDEEDIEGQHAAEEAMANTSEPEKRHDTAIARDEVQESMRLGKKAANGQYPVEEIAAGEKDAAPPAAEGVEAIGIDFLSHAFPSRTKQFLQDMLNDEDGDVQRAIDTLMVLEMAESGALDADDEGEGIGSTSARKSSLTNDDAMYAGSGRKKLSKRDRQRRRVKEAQGEALDGKAAGPSTQRATKINLTDVRHGGGAYRKLQARLPEREEKKKPITSIDEGTIETDADIAARLAREERVAAGLPPEEDKDDAVRDNDWLFSSSVLEQLSVLLDVPSHIVRSIHAQSHMNLRATSQRLIHQQAQLRPTLHDVDKETGEDEGTSALAVQGICALMPSKSRAEVERVLRATNGRQDSTLDLLQLRDRIEDAAAGEKTDPLDPLKADRSTTALADVHGSSSSAIGGGGHSLIDTHRSASSPSPYAAAASHRNRPVGFSAVSTDTSSRSFALQRLREGTPSVTFPLHSGQAEGMSSGDASYTGASAETAAQAGRMAREYSAIADEYRTRRQENLVKAAQAYRSTASGVAGGGGGGKTRGHIRGAAAFAYADEARRLDAKARAFSLQAAQAMVRYRTLVARGGAVRAHNQGGMPSMASHTTSSGRSAAMASARDVGISGRPGDIVDLHGVTVHEALTITRQALQEWWPRAVRSGGATANGRDARNTPPLHIITGVGRHSRGQVAVIRPAVLAMLEREQWRVREPQQGHIVILGQR